MATRLTDYCAMSGSQVPHHQVKQWLHHGRNEHMSAKAYRAHALAELANSATFNYRFGADACAD